MSRRFDPVNDDQFGSASKLVFMSREKEKEWNDLEDSTKKAVLANLHDTADRMSTNISIQMLCGYIQDMDKRIRDLEDKIKKQNDTQS